MNPFDIHDQKESLEEILTHAILSKEKKGYSSKQFETIQKQVDIFFEKQDTQSILSFLTQSAGKLGSSDIHYENTPENIIVRFRIDGILVDIFTIEKKNYKLLLERIKHASGMKLNITQIPQDGKYSLFFENKKIDVRVSTLPTRFGENIVCRILDSTKTLLQFEDLGFFWINKRMIVKSLSKKNGMIIVTGPTGSGKTTTLYTLLSTLNSREKKIITLEDPIEYEIPGLIQSEINEKNNYTYEIGLKAILRQDPDIIMIGEIRDSETLDIAMQASLTGHLVLTTLHTKSASETIERILNMGTKPYILAGAVDIIIAQRLVRRICPHCKTEIEKTHEEELLIKEMMKEMGMKDLLKKLNMNTIRIYTGKGCEHCHYSGYSGRIGIYEILFLTSEIKQMIRNGKSAQDIVSFAKQQDMITMKEDGILKALAGITSVSEIVKAL